MTRTIRSTKFHNYVWHARIADVVAELLDEMTDEPFSYDFRAQDGRGIALDQGHVEHWRSNAPKVGKPPQRKPRSPVFNDRVAYDGPVQPHAIHDAVQENDIAKVKTLLPQDRKAVGLRDKHGRTALNLAVEEADLAMVKLLLQHGADWSALDNFGNTPLSRAVAGRYMDVVDEFVSKGAKLDFDSLLQLNRTVELAAMLRKQPWLAKPPRTALHTAAGRGNLEAARLLLNHGADPNHEREFLTTVGKPYTGLSEAVQTEHFETANLLLQHGARVRVAIFEGKIPTNLLHYAVTHCDARFVKCLIDHGADIHDFSPDWLSKLTPLQMAAGAGRIDNVTLLLNCGADVNAKAPNGVTALLVAVAAQQSAIGSLLLDHKARLDVFTAAGIGRREELAELLKTDPALAKTKDPQLGRTALHWAVQRGDVESVRLLLDHKANVEAVAPYSGFGYAQQRMSEGDRPMHVAARAGHATVVDLLIRQGASVHSITTEGETPLLVAASEGHAAVVKRLLAAGADPNKATKSGYSPLHAAIKHSQVLQLLLDAGADVNRDDQENGSLLRQVAKRRDRKTADMLVARGAKVDLYSACVFGWTDRMIALLNADPTLLNAPLERHSTLRAIELASETGSFAAVKWLVGKGAALRPVDVNEFGYQSPLHLAAAHGHAEVVDLLLAKGLEVELVSSTGQTPLHAAAERAEPIGVELLLKRKSNIHARDKQRRTPLHLVAYEWNWREPPIDRQAVDRNARETVRLLVAAGADVHAVDKDGNTPLHTAASIGQTAVVEGLLDDGAAVNALNRRHESPTAFANDRSRRDPFDRGDIPGAIDLLRRRGGKP